MRIGIDFGTTYTKVAFMDNGELRLFSHPGPNDTYLPSALAYRGGEVSFGKAARAMMNRRGVEYADRFKMLLPLRDEARWAELGWSLKRSPAEVTRDFFQNLVSSVERFLGQRLEGMVVSIPEVWQRTANNFGAEALRRILVDEMRLPVDHLRSEPVCAAAYFVHAYRGAKNSPGDDFNLLVCDMGGGTFDVALCRVRGQKIDVLDFDGMGELGWGAAGALFDRKVVEAALAQQGQSASSDDFIELLHDFEEQKILEHERVSARLGQLLQEDASVFGDTPVYEFGPKGKYQVTLAQVMECFEPVGEAIRTVLGRIRKRCEERKLKIDRVAIVGGFGQFPLVQHTILRNLDIDDENDQRFDRTLHSQQRQFFAIAYGAALIANGVIEPVEYYPHTIAVRVARQSADKRGKVITTDTYLPILEAGRVAAGMTKAQWLEHQGKRVLVRVEKAKVEPLPVYIMLRGAGDWIRLDLPPEEWPEPGRYFVGLLIDRSNLGTLIIESEDGKKRREYRLGNINPVLIAEE